MNLNDAYYFVHVVEKRGFSAAGRVLGIPKSRLSRHVQQLEDRLGVRLLHRSSRQITLTDVGQEYYQHARAALDRMTDAETAVRRKTNVLEGRVTFACSVGMAQFALDSLLPDFLQEHPKVDVVQVVSNEMVDLLETGVDFAIRGHVDQLPDSSLVQLRLAQVDWALFCTPEMRDQIGLDASPHDLANCAGLCLGHATSAQRWNLTHDSGETATLPYTLRFASDDMKTLKRAAEAGLGIVSLPSYVCRAELAAGTLVHALPGWSAGQPQISLLMPSRKGMLPAVEALIAHLRQALPSAVSG
jgi:DNA-binding transcriptional LysR family regulator